MDDYTILTKEAIMALRETTHSALQKAALNAAWAVVDCREKAEATPDELAALEAAAAQAMSDYQASL